MWKKKWKQEFSFIACRYTIIYNAWEHFVIVLSYIAHTKKKNIESKTVCNDYSFHIFIFFECILLSQGMYCAHIRCECDEWQLTAKRRRFRAVEKKKCLFCIMNFLLEGKYSCWRFLINDNNNNDEKHCIFLHFVVVRSPFVSILRRTNKLCDITSHEYYREWWRLHLLSTLFFSLILSVLWLYDKKKKLPNHALKWRNAKFSIVTC